MGAHYYGPRHRRQHVGDLQGKGCWEVGPREVEGTWLGVPFAPGWYQEDFLDSGLENLNVSRPWFAGITLLCILGQVINGLSFNFFISKVSIKRVLGKVT